MGGWDAVARRSVCFGGTSIGRRRRSRSAVGLRPGVRAALQRPLLAAVSAGGTFLGGALLLWLFASRVLRALAFLAR